MRRTITCRLLTVVFETDSNSVRVEKDHAPRTASDGRERFVSFFSGDGIENIGKQSLGDDAGEA
jgi:hypothetical protein